MAIIFTEGFDKYGRAFTQSAAHCQSRMQDLMIGEWTTVAGVNGGAGWLSAPLSSSGQSFTSTGSSGGGAAYSANKTLGANYSRLIGGFRFNAAAFSASQAGIKFLETAQLQAAVSFDSLGRPVIFNSAGTLVATSATAVSAGTTHYLEFDVTFADTGAYQVWLDGISVMSGTSDFKGASNAYANALALGAYGANSQTITIDDFYLDDGTGAALLTSPAIETTFVSADSAVQFTPGNAMFGQWETLGGSSAPGANQLFLRKFTPSVGGNLASVSCIPQATSAGAKFKAVLYADSAGLPTTLLNTGAEITGTGTAAYTNKIVGTFAAPTALVGGTTYWIGFITDTSVALMTYDALTTGWRKTNTYASGPPAPAGAGTTLVDANWCIWGNLTGVTGNAYELSLNPSPSWMGDLSYVTDATVGHEDLYTFTGLVANPATIYSVAVKAIMKNSDAGARTATIQQKSSATDVAGSAFSPGTSNAWQAAYRATDPNGNIAWAKAAVDAAKGGFKVAT